jgi:S-adenosylmethionine decarboxylase
MTKFVAPGKHLLIDLYDAVHLQDKAVIEQALREAALACGATVLQVLLHHFGEGAGVTGLALLAESHISIHTWPEINFAAVDIFLCGTCDPHKAVPVLKNHFEPKNLQIVENDRGRDANPSILSSNRR